MYEIRPAQFLFQLTIHITRSQYSEGPATGHFDTGFSWFPCVYKQMLRWFPCFQVATRRWHQCIASQGEYFEGDHGGIQQ